MITAQKERQKRQQRKRSLTCEFPQSVFEIPTTSSLNYLANFLMRSECLKPFVEKYLPHEIHPDHPVLFDKYALFRFSASNKYR